MDWETKFRKMSAKCLVIVIDVVKFDIFTFFSFSPYQIFVEQKTSESINFDIFILQYKINPLVTCNHVSN